MSQHGISYTLICKKLFHNEHAAVRFPSVAEKIRFAKLIQNLEPEVDNVIGFIDGLSLSTMCNSGLKEQSLFYNGYHHDTRVNNVFAFSPEGKIIYACFNFPGGWHDTAVATHLINEVVDRIGDYAFCVDSGFPRSGRLFEKFVGPMSRRQMKKMPPQLRTMLKRKQDIYVSLRQASEWGMRSLQATFGRLKVKLSTDSSLRHDILLSIILLHNFRTHHVGLNRIATVFNPLYGHYYNTEGYDRISAYYNIE
jgi:hypothetical protein